MIGLKTESLEMGQLQLQPTQTHVVAATTTLKRQQKQKQEQMRLRNTVSKNEWQLKDWVDWTANEIFGVVMLKITTPTS